MWLVAAPVTSGAQAGQQIFESTCAACHGLDGKGGEHAPNIVTDTAVQTKSDAQLTRIIHDGISASGMPAFGSVLQTGQIDGVISYLRSLQTKQMSVLHTGNAATGNKVFTKARCADCHSNKGQGGSVGIDLSAYATTHSVDEFRRELNTHSTEKRKRLTRVVTRQGRTYEGVLRNEDNFSLQLETLSGDFLFFAKRDLTPAEENSSTATPSSSPQFTPGDLDDLMSYLSELPDFQKP